MRALSKSMVATAYTFMTASQAFDFASFTQGIPTISVQSSPLQTGLSGFRAAVLKGKLPNGDQLIAANQALDSARALCPTYCNDAGSFNNWTTYHDASRLSWCNRTMLLDFSLDNPIDNPITHTTIRACTADIESNPQIISGNLKPDSSCVSRDNDTQVQTTLQMGWLNSPSSPNNNTAELVDAAQSAQSYLSQLTPNCNESILFSSSGQTVVGLYAGSEIQRQGISLSLLQSFIAQIENNRASDTLFVELCGKNIRGSDYAFGIIANTNSSLGGVQDAVSTWRDGKCLTSYDGVSAWENITVLVQNPSTANNATVSKPLMRSLRPRDSCSTVEVVSGDSCASLAVKCGISAAAFTALNPAATFCSTLAVSQHVCCTTGTLPDLAPQQNPDGSCFSYNVQSGDDCSALAVTYTITEADIESFNLDTWQWMGCADLQTGENICLSTGTPPFPAPVVNTVCGPQVPGSVPPTDGTAWAEMNPCLLNACCDIWGQCGTTSDFCTPTQSTTGSPGTAAAGSNGCISNCGTDIIISGPPAQYRSIGYFEGFNWDRPCLNMHVTDVVSTKYTHLHMAFAALTESYEVDVSGIQDEFELFLGMTGSTFKRILTFGGWSFSTDPSTYFIFRNAFTSANVETTVANIVAFIVQNGLDGVDIDWEYPGAPDIPGIPPASPEDGTNYFVFLFLLREALPNNLSISIAAPSSFWYLRNFPIQAMSIVLDYIVFMTYDLHGQWDYGNPSSDPGCLAGDCLRSQVNLTETTGDLSMITKAGVPSNQVVVGVTSYGRSFEMTTAGCVDETCTYVGPVSGATLGSCTQEAGYIANGEIETIVAEGRATMQYVDDSFSNILVYDNLQWVSYMDDSNKATRTELYADLNMGGVVDWAIDLDVAATDNGITTGVVPMQPLPCTTLAPQATFTMSAACTAGILALPTTGPEATSGNTPPGEPESCNEVCDFFRLLSGTCCGSGGTFGNPIEIPPNVTIPYDIPLPVGFIPQVPIIIPVPGEYDPDAIFGSGKTPTFPVGVPLETFPAGKPLPTPIILPAGFTNPIPIPIIIPVIPLPNDDPPCLTLSCAPCFAGACGGIQSNNPEDADPDEEEECSTDPDPSSTTGLCTNGNFPLWDDVTGEIDCDTPSNEAAEYMSDCQSDADNDFEDTVQAIDCQVSSCGGTGGPLKRAPACEDPPFSYLPGTAGQCDATFNCDTDIWPNVCNNVRSAIADKGMPSILTYLGQKSHLTARWHDLHQLGPNVGVNGRLEGSGSSLARDSGRIPTITGWGLVGCQVEEYPWGNSVPSTAGNGQALYNDRPTLRLIPQIENGDHGTEVARFMRYVQKLDPTNRNFAYCIEVSGNTQPADYCVNSGAACKNKCAAAYGPAFILVNEIWNKDLNAGGGGITDQRWDRWFDQAPGRKTVHTLSWDPAQLPNLVPVTTLIPPQFGMAPSPGLKIYQGTFPNGNWVSQYNSPLSGNLITVGQGTPRAAISADGSNLRYDDVPASGLFPSKRELQGSDITILTQSMPKNEEDERNTRDDCFEMINGTTERPRSNTENPLLLNESSFKMPKRLSERQIASGSFLDPGVFNSVLGCVLSTDGEACDDCLNDAVDPTYAAGAGQDAPFSVCDVTGPGATACSSPPPPPSPTGFHVVALKCTTACDDALEIVPSAEDDCLTIAENQVNWWGAAFPPGPAMTENDANQLEPFTLLNNPQFTIFYVFGDGFSAQLCGLNLLNITFANTNSGWIWSNTDGHSGTCLDNTASAPNSCSLKRQGDGDQETYTAQEQLFCVDPSDPGYCAT